MAVAERPGHSPTDTVLAADGLLLAGDHLLEKISSNPIAHVPVGAPDPVALAASPDRPRTLLTYLASLEATAAADRGELILPGHGDPFTGAAALVEKRAGMSERRAQKILRRAGRRRAPPPRWAASCGATSRSRRPTSCSPRCSATSTCWRSAARVAQAAGGDGVVRWARA